MKKILTLISLLILSCLTSVAGNQQSSSSSQKIVLNTKQKFPHDHANHRIPMEINITADYDAINNAINIYGDYEGSVEVYLFLDENLVGYSTDLNISLPITSAGLYRIVISGESWYAEGYIKI